MSKYAHLDLPDGITRPYRPKPADFREVYIRNGWCGDEGPIEVIFGTNWRVIRRWIAEEGEDDLRAARAAYVHAQRVEARSRRSRYVLGRTMTAVKHKPVQE